MSAPTVHPRLFRERDADASRLRGKTIAVLGYGLLGRPLALNLRDSIGQNEPAARIIVGSDDDASTVQSRDDGFPTDSLVAAAEQADVALMLLPDEVQADRCPAIWAALRPGAAVVFASGYALAYGLVTPPKEVDVVLFAPRMGGDAIRKRFVDGQGYMAYLGVEQDFTGKARELALAVAAAAGCLKFGALEMTAKQEVVLDLFVEQAFGPWLGAAMLSTFHVGVEAGLPALGLLMELYLSEEMAETFSQMADEGFLPSTLSHGFAASFGGMTRALSIDRQQMSEQMRSILGEITSGAFAEALQDEFRNGYPCRPFLNTVVGGEDDLISCTERDYRQMD